MPVHHAWPALGAAGARRDAAAVSRLNAPGLRILLVYPEIPPTYWNMRHALHFIGKRATMPPLGLITVAGMLPEDCDMRLVDMNVEPLTVDAVAAADVVFTSSMIIQRRSHDQVVRLCNELKKPVVAGGPYPTSSPTEMRGVDHLILGEAEGVLPRFLDDFRRGGAARTYQASTRPELVTTPPPRFDLLDMAAYSTMALQYSRGCPHTCEFCDIIELFGRVPRTKSTPQFLTEVELLYRTCYRGSVFIVDDNFIGDRRRVGGLLAALAEWQRSHDYPFAFFTETTVSLAADDALMEQMIAAGFNMVFLGIETPVAASLRDAAKTPNLKVDLLEAVRRIQRKGLEVAGGFIVGFDHDPEDIFDRQIHFIQEAGIPAAMVGLLSALPNTQLHRRLAAEGRLRETSDGDTHRLRLTFTPKMGEAALLEGYKRVIAELYDPEHYFDRCLALLRNLETHRTSARAVTYTELRAFVLSLALQSASPYRWQYWKYLVAAAMAKPRMLPEAVTMAIKGHHYFKMTEDLLGGRAPERALLEPAGRPLREALSAARAVIARSAAHLVPRRASA